MKLEYESPHSASYNAIRSEQFDLENERKALLERLKSIDERHSHLEKCMEVIEGLVNEDPGLALAEAGLTVACREVMRKCRHLGHEWVSAETVRGRLSELGLKLTGYTNPMAVLHKTLQRMCDVAKDSNNKPVYRLKAVTKKAVSKKIKTVGRDRQGSAVA